MDPIEPRSQGAIATLTAALGAIADVVIRVDAEGRRVHDAALDAINAAKGPIPLDAIVREAARVVAEMKAARMPVTRAIRVGEGADARELEARFVPHGDGALIAVRDASSEARGREIAARQWRSTFDAIASPVILVDAAGRVLQKNRAAASLAGEGVERVDGAGEGSALRRAARLVEHVVASRATAAGSVVDEASGRAWHLVATLADGGSEVDEVIVVFHDVTELVELEEMLRRHETSSILEQLVSGVAHEVRNPLHAITVTLDAFLARFQVADEHQGHVRVLRGEIGKLSELMRVLHEYGTTSRSRLVAGRIEEAIDDAIAAVGPAATGRRVAVARQVDPGLPEVMLDRARLAQALANLVDNAIQHAPEGSEVVVAACASGEGVECRVVDAGPGVREADLPHVFRPFFTRRRGGRGLGLSIAQRVVDEHRGRIAVTNRPEGGALVTVRLPLRASVERG